MPILTTSKWAFFLFDHCDDVLMVIFLFQKGVLSQKCSFLDKPQQKRHLCHRIGLFCDNPASAKVNCHKYAGIDDNYLISTDTLYGTPFNTSVLPV